MQERQSQLIASRLHEEHRGHGGRWGHRPSAFRLPLGRRRQRADPHRVHWPRRTRFRRPREDTGQTAEGRSQRRSGRRLRRLFRATRQGRRLHPQEHRHQAEAYENYEDMLADGNIDAVCIATPDHWHAKQTIDALKAGKHVYCEKPMTHTIDEALAVVDAWKATGKVMQVGVQWTSLPVWDKARELIQQGKLGKVMQLKTAYIRNSNIGQWRYYPLTKNMTPQDDQLAAVAGRGLRPGPGHAFRPRRLRPVAMLLAVRLRHVHRPVRASRQRDAQGDGPAVIRPAWWAPAASSWNTTAATCRTWPRWSPTSNEGCQLLVSLDDVFANWPRIPEAIRGHFGSFVFSGENGFDFLPERPQITHNSKLEKQRIEVEAVPDMDYAHFKNFIDAIEANSPAMVNNAARPGRRRGGYRQPRREELSRGQGVLLQGRQGRGSRRQLGPAVGEDVEGASEASPHPGLEGRRHRQPARRRPNT